MKILALLWEVSLLGLCNASCCGGSTKDDSTVLDLANPDKSLFSTLNGRLGTIYMLASGKEITEIFYGRSKIWKAKDGQGCKWVEVAIDNKGNGMAYPTMKNKEYTKIPFNTTVNNTEDSSASNPSGDSPANEDRNGGSNLNLQGSNNGNKTQKDTKQ
ncbi:signal peptide containing protein [Theileria equi strain WA]|uniref:Signal peptide containing protein n=1 Tax=Theileria equi strain WA TaxID=1537102 RepID=L1LAL6_THEEQ|nr:signal peptide containing protein [Theileria equi strain WA]EKX72284.1 signal peptide containing protein [Theileria equi strain WA]|eukprot:XP_004831736.1 signal peptide containing protein [Theileria equi strain WA]